ncbi:hypothetical protein LCGC14_0536660 [marine sediment metagenome]|uniref:Uncharacterized protein n=1 Tax=marine sediment metagenome TaxID=412755 RepID=A0A0F9SCG9_9ZZZZ|nr:hypothetical protein [Methylophaga sp.]HEC58577.1 hypothetical protein [Methylophaga sp.]
MKMIKLNHTLQSSNKKPMASAALGISLFLLLISLYFFQSSNVMLTSLKDEQQQHSVSSQPRAVAVKLTEQQQTELNAVNAAISDIDRPWQQLFKALEMAWLKDISLLSVEPNAKTKTVHLRAVTLPIEQMSAYITRLKQQKLFKSVSLISTEAVKIDGQDGTQFELIVTWS